MSVIMTMRMKGDPAKLEDLASREKDTLRSIAGAAEQRGVMAHRFYGSDDGEIMVIDEWPDVESFQSFFEEQRERIGPMMQQAGVQSEPEVTFWRKLESHDEIGWGA